jgi:hypothetical protein
MPADPLMHAPARNPVADARARLAAFASGTFASGAFAPAAPVRQPASPRMSAPPPSRRAASGAADDGWEEF